MSDPIHDFFDRDVQTDGPRVIFTFGNHGEAIGALNAARAVIPSEAPARYGNRNVPKMIRQIDDLRKAIRAEGTPAIQEAWDSVEEHIDYAYRGVTATQKQGESE